MPRLLIHNRNDLSSLEICASSGIDSRNDICFICEDNPFLHTKNNISLAKPQSN